MQIPNLLLRPTPLPGQISPKPRKQKKLKKKAEIRSEIARPDLEEEKTPNSLV